MTGQDAGRPDASPEPAKVEAGPRCCACRPPNEAADYLLPIADREPLAWIVRERRTALAEHRAAEAAGLDAAIAANLKELGYGT